MNGYIKIHRCLVNWEWYDDIKTKTLWFHILLMANFIEKQWHGMSVQPGQFITSYASLSAQTGLSVKSVRTSLDKLKSTGEVVIKTANKYTLVTVANWDKFQCLDDEVANKGQSNGNQTANKGQQRKNDKKDKKDNITPITPFEQAIIDFKEFRAKIKKPMTDRAVELLLSNLQKLAGDDEQKKIAILEQSIFHGWQGVFELKDDMVGNQTRSTSKPKKYKIVIDANGKEVSVLDE